MIDKAYSGKLTIRDLWELHNEHRPIFSRALLIYLARLTHWTVLYELLANVVCAAVTFFSILYLLKKTEIQFGKGLLSLVPAISLIVFSLNQSENWFGGFNIQILMNVAAVTLGLIVLAVSDPNWGRTTMSALLGIIATYTFANGLLFWPLGAWILIKKRAWKLIAFWIIVSVAAIAFYFYGYHKPPHHPSPWSFLRDPLQALNYIFAYLGAPLLAFCKKSYAIAESFSEKGWKFPSSLFWLFEHAASVAGAIGVGVYFYLYNRLKTLKQNGILISFFALSSYALLSAVLSAFGRSAMGIQNALSLRYVTISSLFWISLLVFLKLSSTFEPKSRKWNLSIATIIFLVFLNSIYGGLYAVKQYSYLIPARNELYRMQDEELLKRLLPDTDWIRRSVPILKKHHLSVFKEDEK